MGGLAVLRATPPLPGTIQCDTLGSSDHCAPPTNFGSCQLGGGFRGAQKCSSPLLPAAAQVGAIPFTWLQAKPSQTEVSSPPSTKWKLPVGGRIQSRQKCQGGWAANDQYSPASAVPASPVGRASSPCRRVMTVGGSATAPPQEGIRNDSWVWGKRDVHEIHPQRLRFIQGMV